MAQPPEPPRLGDVDRESYLEGWLAGYSAAQTDVRVLLSAGDGRVGTRALRRLLALAWQRR